jgi:hypothetical protein
MPGRQGERKDTLDHFPVNVARGCQGIELRASVGFTRGSAGRRKNGLIGVQTFKRSNVQRSPMYLQGFLYYYVHEVL